MRASAAVAVRPGSLRGTNSHQIIIAIRLAPSQASSRAGEPLRAEGIKLPINRIATETMRPITNNNTRADDSMRDLQFINRSEGERSAYEAIIAPAPQRRATNELPRSHAHDCRQ